MKLTDEEKKAIEIVKQIEQHDLLDCWDYGEEEYKALQILLNLIEKQQKEIEGLTTTNKELDRECSRLEKKEVILQVTIR